jgi:hypothetical protein
VQARARTCSTRSRSARVPGGPSRLSSAREGMPERIGELREALRVAHERAGSEGAELERVVVQHALGLWVGRQQHLESAVEQEAVERVGGDAAPDAIGPLEHEHVEPACWSFLAQQSPASPAPTTMTSGTAKIRLRAPDSGPDLNHRRVFL